MSEYKLVPFEPTPEMVKAAEEAHMPFGDMELALRMAVLAAPTVQVEPVAYAVFADNGNIRIWSADPIQTETLRLEYGDQVQPLYTAPQLVEQPPLQRQSVLDLSEAARCLGIAQEKGDQDAIDHWGAMVARFERVLIQSAEQQPTCPTCLGGGWDIDCQNRFRPVTCPDCAGSGKFEHSITAQESDSVAPDVTALVEALTRCQHQASYYIGDSEVLADQLAKVREIVNETLAAYHKQGGEQ